MKKTLSIMILIATLFALCLSITAAAEEEKKTLDASFEELLSSKITEEEATVLSNTEYYTQTLLGENVMASPMIRINYTLYSKEAPTLQEKLESDKGAFIDASNYPNMGFLIYTKQYYIFAEIPYLLTMQEIIYPDRTVISMEKNPNVNEVPRYISEFYDLQKEITINGQPCVLEDVFCFDHCAWATLGYSNKLEAAVYLKTNIGTFVKFYPDMTSDPILYTQEEFEKHALAYCEYSTSEEYQEYWKNRFGESPSFLDFVNKDGKYRPLSWYAEQVRIDKEKEYQREIEGFKEKLPFYLICAGIVIVVTVVLVGVILGSVLIVRKIRKKKG